MSLYRIDKLFNFKKGVLQSSKCESGKYNFITAAAEWKTHKEYSYDCEALVFAAAASGSLGRTHYVNGKFISSDLCFIITPKDPKNFPIDLKFYHIIFNEFKKDIVKNTKAGTSKEAIGLTAFGKYELPYFEIEKQIEIKNQFVNAEECKEELETELTHQQDLLKLLRQSFLREAMQGKLVKQDKKEGNGTGLLNKIKSEKGKLLAEKKIRKEKELQPIKEEEIPFEIPNNWFWCRFQEITKLITCGMASTPKYYPSGKIFLSAKNVKPFRFIPDEHKFVDEETYRKITQNAKPEFQDILITRVGAGIGETALIDREIDFAFYVSLTLVKPMKEYINPMFLTMFLNSPQGISNAVSFTTGVKSSQGNLNVEKVRKFLIPLPPLAEQKRIVKKLEEVMNLCEELKTTITDNQTYTDMLLQVALKDALQMKEVEVVT